MASSLFSNSISVRKESTLLKITEKEFLLLRDFVYQQCGIYIAENRTYLLENRLAARIRELNLRSYEEYYNFVRFDKGEIGRAACRERV